MNETPEETIERLEQELRQIGQDLTVVSNYLVQDRGSMNEIDIHEKEQ